MGKSAIEKKLEYLYLRILDKHGNSTWAVAEMEWMIFVHHARELEQLDDEDQWIVRNYMGSLKKLHGGK